MQLKISSGKAILSAYTHTPVLTNIYTIYNQLKGPIKAVSGHRIAPNRFKTTYRSVLTFEEKKQSITHLFYTFSGLD